MSSKRSDLYISIVPQPQAAYHLGMSDTADPDKTTGWRGSRELWLATPERTLHFNFDAERGWLHDSGEGTLGEVLASVLEDLSGEELELDIDADSL